MNIFINSTFSLFDIVKIDVLWERFALALFLFSKRKIILICRPFWFMGRVKRTKHAFSSIYFANLTAGGTSFRSKVRRFLPRFSVWSASHFHFGGCSEPGSWSCHTKTERKLDCIFVLPGDNLAVSRLTIFFLFFYSPLFLGSRMKIVCLLLLLLSSWLWRDGLPVSRSRSADPCRVGRHLLRQLGHRPVSQQVNFFRIFSTFSNVVFCVLRRPAVV